MLSWSKTRENEAFFHGWDRLDRVSLETTKNTRRRRGVNTVENTFDHRHECFRFFLFFFFPNKCLRKPRSTTGSNLRPSLFLFGDENRCKNRIKIIYSITLRG